MTPDQAERFVAASRELLDASDMRWTIQASIDLSLHPRKPLVFVTSPRTYSALCRGLGYKAWIETKGRRGHKPPRAWLG